MTINADTLRQTKYSPRENGADRVKSRQARSTDCPGNLAPVFACPSPLCWLCIMVLLGTCLWLGVSASSTLQLGSGFWAGVCPLSTLLAGTPSSGPLYSTEVQAVVLPAQWAPPHFVRHPRPMCFTSLLGQAAVTAVGPSPQQCSQIMLY